MEQRSISRWPFLNSPLAFSNLEKLGRQLLTCLKEAISPFLLYLVSELFHPPRDKLQTPGPLAHRPRVSCRVGAMEGFLSFTAPGEDKLVGSLLIRRRSHLGQQQNRVLDASHSVLSTATALDAES